MNEEIEIRMSKQTILLRLNKIEEELFDRIDEHDVKLYYKPALDECRRMIREAK